MAKYASSDARANFNEVIEKSQTEAVKIEKHGKSVAVIISAMKYQELLERIEDLSDNLEYLRAKLEPNDPDDFATLTEVKRELGL